MKRASRRVISIVALGAALLTGCESEYDKLTDDLLETGWGEDAAMLPACTPSRPDAATPTPDASTSDAGSDAAAQDGGSDAGADGGAEADGSTTGDASNGDGGDGG